LEQDSAIMSDEELILDQDDMKNGEFETELFNRQIGYPPIPEYVSPLRMEERGSAGRTATGLQARERLGTLTPMEEITEPPSSAATSTHLGDHR